MQANDEHNRLSVFPVPSMIDYNKDFVNRKTSYIEPTCGRFQHTIFGVLYRIYGFLHKFQLNSVGFMWKIHINSDYVWHHNNSVDNSNSKCKCANYQESIVMGIELNIYDSITNKLSLCL